MKKIFLLTSLLLLSASWALAQYSSGSDNSSSGSNTGAYSSQQGQKSSSMAPQGSTPTASKIEGCLSESNGKFTLTDNSGTAYLLTGKMANLKAHVGHTIQVTGKVTGSSAPGSMSGESNMEQRLHVTSFRHVSTSCKGSMH